MIADRGKVLGTAGDGRLLARKIERRVLERPAC